MKQIFVFLISFYFSFSVFAVNIYDIVHNNVGTLHGVVEDKGNFCSLSIFEDWFGIPSYSFRFRRQLDSGTWRVGGPILHKGGAAPHWSIEDNMIWYITDFGSYDEFYTFEFDPTTKKLKYVYLDSQQEYITCLF